MPIKGTSEIRRLMRLGKIRLGIKKESPRTGNLYPEATDYFVCPEEVRAIYGDKPTELKIVFPTEDSPQQWLKRYSLTRGLVCRGDGEKAMAQVDMKTGEIAGRDSEHTTLREIPCDREKCPAYQAKQCRPIMTLQFLIPDVPGALGVYQIDTSSYNSIVNINSSLELIKACGRVSMIPLILKLVPLQVQPEGKRKTVHVLDLVSPYTFTELLQLSSRSPKDIFLLPAPEEPPDDLYPPEIIGEEGNNVEPEPQTDTPGTTLPPTKPEIARALAWAEMRTLQAQLNQEAFEKAKRDGLDMKLVKTAVSDAMIRAAFKGECPGIKLDNKKFSQEVPNWATLETILKIHKRLEVHRAKIMQQTTKQSETKETAVEKFQPAATQTHTVVTGNEVLDI